MYRVTILTAEASPYVVAKLRVRAGSKSAARRRALRRFPEAVGCRVIVRLDG